jgi:hypothetical protein
MCLIRSEQIEASVGGCDFWTRKLKMVTVYRSGRFSKSNSVAYELAQLVKISERTTLLYSSASLLR